jgi:hypothetical protein
MAQQGKNQPQSSSFDDAIGQAMQALAGGMAAPDADVHFATECIRLMGSYLQQKHNPQGQGGKPQGQPASGPPGAGPSPVPGGPPGGAPQNGQMPSLGAPTAPNAPGGGPSPGLTPNPDELRRVLQEVSGQ